MPENPIQLATQIMDRESLIGWVTYYHTIEPKSPFSMDELIAKAVEDFQGLKGTQLVALIAMYYHAYKWSMNSEHIMQSIDAAVAKGLVREIEYKLPNLPYKIKSFYLPGAAEIAISGANSQ